MRDERNDGKEYEELIHKIYRDLSKDSIVTYDDKIFDKSSKTHRQIDVSIRFNSSFGVEFLTIIQVKDYKHRAGPGVVEEFNGVIQDTGAHKGILICSKGFTKAAINKAQDKGIDLLSVHSALNKKWSTLLKVQIEHTIHSFYAKLDFKQNIADLAGTTMRLDGYFFTYDQYSVMDLADLVFEKAINKTPWKDLIKGKLQSIDINNPKIYFLVNQHFRELESGILHLKYIKTVKKKHLIEPDDYITIKDHLKDKEKIHKISVDFTKIEENFILDRDAASDNLDINSVLPKIMIETFNFLDFGYKSIMKINFPLALVGDLFSKGMHIMTVNEWSEKKVNIERSLRGL